MCFVLDGIFYKNRNHEEVILKILGGSISALASWFEFGGRACLRSYDVDNLGEINLDSESLLARAQRAVPKTHIEFMNSFENYHVFGKYLCVHAGIKPKVSLEKQNPRDMRWIRSEFLNYIKPHPYIIVHGHSVVEQPEHHFNRIAVDTGVYKGRPLTAVRIEDEDVSFIQSEV